MITEPAFAPSRDLDRLGSMHPDLIRRKPPEQVLGAFGADGMLAPLTGGRGLAWRAGSVVLKPADTSEESLAWQAETLAHASGNQLRVAMPRRSAHGAFVVDGWMASTFCEGSHQRGRWLDIIAVGDRLHAALARVPRPAFDRGRDDPWAKADRVAWGEASVTPYLPAPHVARLAALRAPVDDPSQLIHGDLTGNVLFADPLPPAVIDLTVYWRPAAYARAIVVADALAWEGATPGDLAAVTSGEGFGQLLARALLARIVTDWLSDAHSAPARGSAYASAVNLAVGLIEHR
jgi:uncharacterized protein (TIGR02569 family)